MLTLFKFIIFFILGSHLHKDVYEHLEVVVAGKKYIRLYHYKDQERLYPRTGNHKNISQVNFKNPDNDKFPLFKDTEYLVRFNFNLYHLFFDLI